jgi:LPXTG-site transpeptidase (sortase) family protein
VTSFVLLCSASYLFFNYEALTQQLAFNEGDALKNYTEQKTQIATQSVAGSTSGFVATENRLEIPKLNLIGNILYPHNEAEVAASLDSGVVHLPQSARPGEPGSSILTAHSSSLKKGYYSSIFSNLNKLENGDIIILYKNSDIIVYKVYDKDVIKPRLENLKKEKRERLILITCWPIGTTENRLAIYAEKLN